jgi:hypothetical protein
MIKIKILSLLISLTLTSQVWAAAWDQSMPLQSSEQQAEAFLKIRALIPSMSQGASRYAFNPVQLLQNQVKIESLMAENSTYAELKNARQDLVNFTVLAGVKESGDMAAKQNNWSKWIESSTAIAHHAGVHSEASAVQKIQELIASPWLGKSQGLVVGLAQLLPNELKKEFFAMPLPAKVEALEKHLPVEVVSQGFVPARLGWNDSEISKTEIINRLKLSVQAEQVFTALIVYHYSLSQNDLAAPKDYLNKWQLAGPAKKTLEQVFNSQVSKLIPAEQKAPEVSLVIREIPPMVGVFRGFAGNDCSTYCSFPFVNAPNEYTFLVYDAKGGIKGYVQGTKVLVHGRAAFYLHTVVGPRMSHEDALNIMRVLNQEKSHMGWSEILLPTPDKISGLVNSMVVQDAMRAVISSEKVPMDYQDGEIRQTLKSEFKLQKKYDDADENKQGNRLVVAKLGPEVSVNRGQSGGLEKVDGRIDKNELIGMLLQLGKESNNRLMIDALVAHAGLDSVGVQTLIRKMQNYSQYPAQHFIEDFAENLKKEGFTFKDDYFQKNISLVAMGLLRSPDLSANKKLLYATLESLYEQRQLGTAEDFLEKNKNLYADKKVSDAFFRAYYNDYHEAELKVSASLRLALGVRAQNILADPELLSFIMVSEQATNVLRDFLLERPLMSRGLESSPAGRKLLGVREDYRKKLNIVLSELLKADSEQTFVRILDDRVSEVFKLGLLGRVDIQRKLMAAGLTHYLSLKPKTTLYIARPLFDEKGYEREASRLMPYVVRSAELAALNRNILMMVNNTGGEKLLEAAEPAIMAGLRQRSDLLEINVRTYPGLQKLKSLPQLRCERLF